MASLATVRVEEEIRSLAWIDRDGGKTSSALAFLRLQVGVSVQSEDRHAA